jgi:hypothetical protein
MYQSWCQSWSVLKRLGLGMSSMAALLPVSVGAAGADWYAERLAEALGAAPPSVTHRASVYAWGDDGQDAQLVLIREGTGPYTCVASGGASPHIGDPPFPLPDPFCADRNAWAFIRALWAEPNPQEPATPLPQIPGLVWRLGGLRPDHSPTAQGETPAAPDPHPTHAHILIMPLPTNDSEAVVPTVFNGNQPPMQWTIAAKRLMEPLLIHIPALMQRALMAPPPP